MQRLELGVFLPVGSGGFVLSSHSPQYRPTYRLQRDITMMAEALGLDYVFSMSKWRGFGGQSEFWDHTLESFTVMTALAAETERLRLIATVNPLLFHPVLMAKLAASADDISGGRLGLNLVTGSSMAEFQQMGVVPEGYDADRYGYAAEWIQVLKRLWTEERVTHHGRYFHLEDCVSSPKPLQRPGPFLVCAGTSDEGLRFTCREADYSFVGGKDFGQTIVNSRRAKQIAAEQGRKIKTATALLVVQGDTTDDAQAEWERIVDGADTEGIGNIVATFGGEVRESSRSRVDNFRENASRVSFAGRPVIGSAEDIASSMADLAADGSLDSILLIFNDYLDGLERFGAAVLPKLATRVELGGQLAA
jgi:pyrimidine oxygenase